jgi:hypothetical protein
MYAPGPPLARRATGRVVGRREREHEDVINQRGRVQMECGQMRKDTGNEGTEAQGKTP